MAGWLGRQLDVSSGEVAVSLGLWMCVRMQCGRAEDYLGREGPGPKIRRGTAGS